MSTAAELHTDSDPAGLLSHRLAAMPADVEAMKGGRGMDHQQAADEMRQARVGLPSRAFEQFADRWQGEAFHIQSAPSANLSWDEFIVRLREVRLAPDVLPLATDRRPFARLALDAVDQIARRALSTPERRGRLTDAVRRFAGITRVPPAKFFVTEAHIDLTCLDDDLRAALIDLGFEPDNFAKISPPKYRFHFTLQYVSAQPAENRRSVYRAIEEATGGAALAIDTHPLADGYVETEAYSSDYHFTQPYRDLDPRAAAAFPFEAATFLSQSVPNTAAEVTDSGLPLTAKRAADIHVKVPAARYERANGSLPEHRSGSLKDALERSGFYEILSEAGNYMYSAHFSALRDADEAHAELVRFVGRAGGASGVSREICTALWRKRTVADGETVWAEVPPHLVRASAADRVSIDG
jgi:hypothetical protein